MKIFDWTGKKIGTWSIVEKVRKESPVLYKAVCECGKEKIVKSKKIKRLGCLECSGRKKMEAFVGRRNGRLTCIAVHKFKKANGILVQCDCGHTIPMKVDQFLKTQTCFSCKFGFYPGKKIKGSVLIERANGGEWKKRCLCGNEFTADSRKTDCGCVSYKKRIANASKKIGLSYENLTIKKIISHSSGRIHFLVRCKCGNELVKINGHEFKDKSCGCLMNLPVGEDASGATLKNYEVISMRELFGSGCYSIDTLAKMFNKNPGYISRIIRRVIWKHI